MKDIQNYNSVFSLLKKHTLQTGEKRSYYQLTKQQMSIYLLSSLQPDCLAYNMPFFLKFNKNIDQSYLKTILQKLVERHDVFRIYFTVLDDMPIMKLKDSVYLNISCEKTDKTVDEIMQQFVVPFALNDSLLFRIKLYETASAIYLAFDIHHIISDGITNSMLQKELMLLFKGESLPNSDMQYTDYSVWQEKSKDLMIECKKYWQEMLSDNDSTINLHSDLLRPKEKTYLGDSKWIVLQSDKYEKIKTFCREAAFTEYIFFLSVFGALLHKLTGQDDIIFGSPVSGRDHRQLNLAAGLFVSILPLRSRLSPQMTLLDYLSFMKQAAMEAMLYHYFSINDHITAKDMSSSALFNIVISYQVSNFNIAVQDSSDMDIVEFNAKTSKYDLTFEIFEGKNDFTIRLEYSKDLFYPNTIKRFSQYCLKVMDCFLTNKNMQLSEIQLITEEEKKNISYINEHTVNYGSCSLLDEFQKVVNKNPDNIAAKTKDEQFTFRQLDILSDRLAKVLELHGLKEQEIVALHMDRSPLVLISMLAILKHNAIFLPININDPIERKKKQLYDGTPLLLLTDDRNAKVSKMIFDVVVHASSVFEQYENDTSFVGRVSNENDLAYIVFTSGSTGDPKGVMIEHYTFINKLKSMQRAFPLTQKDVMLQKTAYTFDVSFWELFWPLMEGVCIGFMEQDAEKDPKKIIDSILLYKATVIYFIPSMLNVFLEYVDSCNRNNDIKSLRLVFTSGEPLLESHVLLARKILSDHRLVNEYGPTEATIEMTQYDCTNYQGGKVSIGRPIPNVGLHIKNREGFLQPIGVPGEVYIGGKALARGYLNEPEQTHKQFVYDEMTGERQYKTGDLARWLGTYEVEFLERIDSQVKIRGVRIEPDEITNALQSVKGIKIAAVTVENDKICAYYSCTEDITDDTIKTELKKLLPENMVPHFYCQMKIWPLLNSGKINKKALPKIEKASNETVLVLPQNIFEKKLAVMLQQILGHQIGVTHDFYQDLNIDSLKTIRMITHINQIFGIEVSMRELYQYGNVKELAMFIASKLLERQRGENHD